MTSWFYFLSNLISSNEKVQTNKQTILSHNVKIHLKIDRLIFYIYQFNVQSMLEINKTIRQLKEHSNTCKHCFGTFFFNNKFNATEYVNDVFYNGKQWH